jgi:hypothetical protein
LTPRYTGVAAALVKIAHILSAVLVQRKKRKQGGLFRCHWNIRSSESFLSSRALHSVIGGRPTPGFFRKDNAMRKTAVYLITAALMTATALAGPAAARDRSDRVELTANQMADRSDARIAKMKVDLNLTADQDKNWAGFTSAMQDMNKKQADRRIARRDTRAQQQGSVDLIDELRRNADSQIEHANERKKLADAAQPLYASLNEQQKNRFAEMLFGGDRERDNRRMDRTSD